jgi:hypothetical protein
MKKVYGDIDVVQTETMMRPLLKEMLDRTPMIEGDTEVEVIARGNFSEVLVELDQGIFELQVFVASELDCSEDFQLFTIARSSDVDAILDMYYPSISLVGRVDAEYTQLMIEAKEGARVLIEPYAIASEGSAA